MSGGRATRGAKQVVERWKGFFEGPQAPFSWEPEFVEVLDSGTLAMSSGPVRDPSGKRIGTFNSVWRREKNGQWKIVSTTAAPPVLASKWRRLMPALSSNNFSLRKQQLQILRLQIADQAVVLAQNRVRQVALGLLQLQHLLFYRIPRN